MYCGLGSKPGVCPSESRCTVHPTDFYAVCCPTPKCKYGGWIRQQNLKDLGCTGKKDTRCGPGFHCEEVSKYYYVCCPDKKPEIEICQNNAPSAYNAAGFQIYCRAPGLGFVVTTCEPGYTCEDSSRKGFGVCCPFQQMLRCPNGAPPHHDGTLGQLFCVAPEGTFCFSCPDNFDCVPLPHKPGYSVCCRTKDCPFGYPLLAHNGLGKSCNSDSDCPQKGYRCHRTFCCPDEKPGVCPLPWSKSPCLADSVDECENDDTCEDDHKCCSNYNGCFKKCMKVLPCKFPERDSNNLEKACAGPNRQQCSLDSRCDTDSAGTQSHCCPLPAKRCLVGKPEISSSGDAQLCGSNGETCKEGYHCTTDTTKLGHCCPSVSQCPSSGLETGRICSGPRADFVHFFKCGKDEECFKLPETKFGVCCPIDLD